MSLFLGHTRPKFGPVSDRALWIWFIVLVAIAVIFDLIGIAVWWFE